MKFGPKPMLIGAAAGLVFGLTLLGLVALSFGTAEGAYWARVFFPYAVVADETSQAWVGFGLLFLQYPFYGALLGIVGQQITDRRLMLVAVLTLIVSAHCVAVRAAHRADAIWVESQGGE